MTSYAVCARCHRPVTGTSDDPLTIECDGQRTTIWCFECDEEFRLFGDYDIKRADWARREEIVR